MKWFLESKALDRISVVLLVLFPFLIIGLSACGSDKPPSHDVGGRSVAEINSSFIAHSIETIVVHGETREYVCFTFVTAGVWCDRVRP